MNLSETSLKVKKSHTAGKVTFQDDPEEEEAGIRSVVEKSGCWRGRGTNF